MASLRTTTNLNEIMWKTQCDNVTLWTSFCYDLCCLVILLILLYELLCSENIGQYRTLFHFIGRDLMICLVTEKQSRNQ